MPNYKQMYLDLFNATTNAIAELQQAQREAEKKYIEAEDTPVVFACEPKEGV